MLCNREQQMAEKMVPLPDLMRAKAAKDPQYRAELEVHALGWRIKQLRSEKRISERKLAKMIGSDRSLLRLIEAGKHLRSVEQLRKLAEALGAETELPEWMSIVE
jgi:ribosome-binding protein aMBF1 (putative translation factor)